MSYKEQVIIVPLEGMLGDVIDYMRQVYSNVPDLTSFMEHIIGSFDTPESFTELNMNLQRAVANEFGGSPTVVFEISEYFRSFIVNLKQIFIENIPQYDNYKDKGWDINMVILLDSGTYIDQFTGTWKDSHALSITLYKHF